MRRQEAHIILHRDTSIFKKCGLSQLFYKNSCFFLYRRLFSEVPTSIKEYMSQYVHKLFKVFPRWNQMFIL